MSLPGGPFSKLIRHRRDLPLLVEAASELVLASAAIQFLPFRRILRRASRDVSGRALTGAERLAIGARVKWAVTVCAYRLPWRSLCFPQGLAAQRMLRRRGIDSTFYYGARIAEEGMNAHVWVCDEGRPIVGGRVPDDMRVLLQAPPAEAATALDTAA